MQVSAARVSAPSEIAPSISNFARQPNGGIVVTPDAITASNLEHIITLSNEQRLPSIFVFRIFPAGGGLLSYGSAIADIFAGSAAYVHRILNGEKLSGLPVQNPARYYLVVNLNTAKALGLTIPPSLLARADEVIE
jgi:putative ABC transport system substrate-binding protein